MSELEELVGVEAVKLLASKWGGTRLRIPKGESPRALEIRQLIGAKACDRLQFYYGDGRVYIPTYRSSPGRGGSEIDKQELISLSLSLSRRQLALRFKVSESSIYKILRQHKHCQQANCEQ